jgi:hypothetical protein
MGRVTAEQAGRSEVARLLRREVLISHLAEQLQSREVGGGLFGQINDHN